MVFLVDFLTNMPFWYWWALAVALLILELMSGSTYLLWPAAAAVLVGFTDIWPLDHAWRMQLALFAALTILLTIIAPPFVKPWLKQSQTDHFNLNERGAQKVGRRVTVEQAFSNGVGRVKMGDTVWLAEAEDGADFSEGASVEVTRTEGAKLFVRGIV
ncbi:MAG: NfeD family protein [Pseudomonadota bacterium]